MNADNRKAGWLEPCLTPLIGLACLALYIHHHGFRLAGSVVVAILAGSVPLIATAVIQRWLSALNWYGWVRILAAVLVGGAIVGAFYYYALYPAALAGDPARWATDAEGHGNDVALYNYQTENFAIIGAFSAGVSAVVAQITGWIAARRSRCQA